MSCFNNNSLNINDYCDKCKMIINFSTEVWEELDKYLNNGGDISNFTELDCETFIPIFRVAISKCAIGISDLNEKQNNDNQLYSHQLSSLFSNLPDNLEEREQFIANHSGYATVIISKQPWFKELIQNISETYLVPTTESQYKMKG